MKFTLNFKEYIGKTVTIIDEDEYLPGLHIEGRYYHGKFNGTVINSSGIYFLVDNNKIKVSTNTVIEFK